MNTIDITTTQSVTIEYNLASLRERFLGFLLDMVIVTVALIALILIFIGSMDVIGGGNQTLSTLFSVLFGGGMLIIYNLVCESVLDGQSIGKRAMNTKVVRVDGKPISFSDSLLRSMLVLVDFSCCLGAIGGLLISTNDKRQRLGDMAAGTTVIKKSSDQQFSLYDILTINTLENYTPQYNQVRNLSEEDMLLIKSAIIRYQQYPNGAHIDAIKGLVKHVCDILDIKVPKINEVEFLKILLKDYIVLTR